MKSNKLNRIMSILSTEYKDYIRYRGFTYLCNMIDICNGSTLYSLNELYMLVGERLSINHLTIEKGIRRFKDMVVGKEIRTKDFLNRNIILVNDIYEKDTI